MNIYLTRPKATNGILSLTLILFITAVAMPVEADNRDIRRQRTKDHNIRQETRITNQNIRQNPRIEQLKNRPTTSSGTTQNQANDTNKATAQRETRGTTNMPNQRGQKNPGDRNSTRNKNDRDAKQARLTVDRKNDRYRRDDRRERYSNNQQQNWFSARLENRDRNNYRSRDRDNRRYNNWRGDRKYRYPRYIPLTFRGINYYYFNGGYYRYNGYGFTLTNNSIGFYLYRLPYGYTRLVIDDYPYYYFNRRYYVHDQDRNVYVQVDDPYESSGGDQDAYGYRELYVYPNEGQDEQQVSEDKYECHLWAVEQTGFDPSLGKPGNLEDYHRAQAACLEGRGYTVN